MGRNGKALGVCIAALLLTVFALLALSMAYMLEADRAIAESMELRKKVEALEARPLTVELVKEDKPEYHEGAWQNIGACRITHYCACEKCCGKSTGVTASGKLAAMGRTVAVDPGVIPLGSEVLINGVCYIAEDVGVRGKAIDIYIDSHSQALAMGTYKTEVSYR